MYTFKDYDYNIVKKGGGGRKSHMELNLVSTEHAALKQSYFSPKNY